MINLRGTNRSLGFKIALVVFGVAAIVAPLSSPIAKTFAASDPGISSGDITLGGGTGTADSTGATSTGAAVNPMNIGPTGASPTEEADKWVEDRVVTSVGKAASRAREVLNWCLSIKDSGFYSAPTGQKSTSESFKMLWKKIANFTYAFYFIILIVMGYGIMFRANWAERARRSFPVLLISFAATFLSFVMLVPVIQYTDKATQAFYRIHNSDETSMTDDQKHLKAEDLLTVDLSYQTFVGYRLSGGVNDESVKNLVILVKMVTWTNYAIAFVIVVRIIILWFLVIFSPFLFPFLAFAATRNVATIWLREFFRWLFLGPLFALFLTAIPFVWKNTSLDVSGTYAKNQRNKVSGIPLVVNKSMLQQDQGNSNTLGNVYKSGTNIILISPGTKDFGLQINNDLAAGNNLSETDAYARYLVALLMMWTAIILPFILLRAIMNFSVELGKSVYNNWNKSSLQSLLNMAKSAPPTSPKPGPGPVTGSARDIRSIIPSPKDIRQSSVPQRVEQLSIPSIMSLSGLKQAIPANIENMMADKKKSSLDLARVAQNESAVSAVRSIMDKISQPEKISDKVEAQKFNNLKNSIFSKDLIGDQTAANLNSAVTNNISKYTSADLNQEIMEKSLEQFRNSVKDALNTNATLVQNFQSTHQTQTTNLAQYLGSQQDPMSQQALRALEDIKKILESQTSAAALSDQFHGLTSIISKLKNPEKISDKDEQEKFAALKGVLEEGAKQGDVNLLGMNASADNIVNAASDQANKLPQEAIEQIEALSESDQDFAEAKQSWEKFYTESPVPITSTIRTRREWVEHEVEKIQGVLKDITSDQTQTRKQAIEEIGDIIPVALMGDYQLLDIIKYLLSKLHGAQDSLKNINETEEDSLVDVKKAQKVENKKEMMLDENGETIEKTN